MADIYKGSCLCGAVSFEVEGFDDRAAHCHCRMCRKFHGAEYATYVSVPRRSFSWCTGLDAIAEYEAANGTVRTFCATCGSSLLFVSPRADQEFVEVPLGIFDTDVPVVPDAHIFMDYAASWSSVTDGLPQFPEERPSQEPGDGR